MQCLRNHGSALALARVILRGNVCIESTAIAARLQPFKDAR